MMTAPVQSKSFVGRGLWQKQALGLLFAVLVLPATAAPLDVLLTATPELFSPNGYLEIGADRMNAQLDFFNIRDKDALAKGTQAGDYSGAHVAGSWRVHDKFWLSGSLWQRDLNGLSEAYNFRSWQLSGMYRMREADGKLPALALRVSAWGNEASDIGASNICAAPLVGTLKNECRPDMWLDKVKITQPGDKSLQADLIATWALSSSTDVTLMFGAGRTELSYGEVRASLKRSNKPYDLSFQGNDIRLAAADGSLILRESASNYGIDIAKELAWRGNFVQLGVNASWRQGPWTLRGGYLYYTIERDGVDEILSGRGWSTFSKVKTLTLEANYRFTPRLSGFVRGQVGTSLMFNDMPVIYNSYSSDLFGGRYSVYTVGLRADF